MPVTGIALPVYNTYCFSTACLVSVKRGGIYTKHRLEFALTMEAACSSETLHFHLTHVLVTAQTLMSMGTVFCVLEISSLANVFLSVLWRHVSSLWNRLAGPPSWDFRPSVTPSQLNLKGRVVSMQQRVADTTRRVNSHSSARVVLVPYNPLSHFRLFR